MCLMHAMNKVNEERYMVKTFMQEYTPEDNDGKPIPNAEVQRSIVFSFETLCFTESITLNISKRTKREQKM